MNNNGSSPCRRFSFPLILLAFFGLAAVTLLPGCGYTTKSTLPKSLRTIYVEPFKNSIDFTSGSARNLYLPLLEVDARNAVINRFLFDGNLKISDPDTADLVLKGELKGFERAALRYTDNEDVQEYRIQITVDFELYNTKQDLVSWSEPGFAGQATYFLAGSQAATEESALKEAILDLARRIVERTIEDW